MTEAAEEAEAAVLVQNSPGYQVAGLYAPIANVRPTVPTTLLSETPRR